jgi:hypothetical protein
MVVDDVPLYRLQKMGEDYGDGGWRMEEDGRVMFSSWSFVGQIGAFFAEESTRYATCLVCNISMKLAAMQ